MSFERKNKEVKEGALSSNCSKNLPFTLGIRNQLNLCYRYSFCDNINDDITLGPIDEKNVEADVRAINKSILVT